MNENSKTKPIEDILDRMACICYKTAQQNKKLDVDEIDALVESLSTNGWKRHQTDDPPLAVQIERRAVELGGEEIENHRKLITSAAEQIAETYRSREGFETSAPDNSPGNNDQIRVPKAGRS